MVNNQKTGRSCAFCGITADEYKAKEGQKFFMQGRLGASICGDCLSKYNKTMENTKKVIRKEFNKKVD